MATSKLDRLGDLLEAVGLHRTQGKTITYAPPKPTPHGVTFHCEPGRYPEARITLRIPR